MVRDYVLDEEFFSSLMELDAEIARRVAAEGCPRCGGPLHQANYERKPRGGLMAKAGEAFSIRHSLCCGAQGCRRRLLPPSLRFLGRRVYLEVVVLLASMVMQMVATRRKTRAETGVPEWTLRRWGSWWREAFVQSRTWADLRARFAPPPPEATDLPRSLVVRIEEEIGRRAPPSPSRLRCEVCRFVARLLAPVTTSSVADGSRFVRSLAEDGVVE